MDKQKLLNYLNNTLTPPEAKEVEDWVSKSKDNSNIFNELKTEFVINSLDDTAKEMSLDKEYSHFKNKYILEKHSFFIRFRPILKYAAIVVGLVSIGYFTLSKNDGANEAISSQAITLKLDDGKTIILDGNNSQIIKDRDGSIIGKLAGNKLHYTMSKSTENVKYNTLSVPYGKTFEMVLSDGTKVHVGAGSSLDYPTQFPKKGNRKVSIIGEAYLEVSKDSERPFIVNTGDLNVRVLGTQFNITNYPGDITSEVVLVEGSVELYADNEEFEDHMITKLEPGYMASFDKNSISMNTKMVDTRLHTSWIHGELIFRNESFENILKKLEKYYDVRFVTNNREISEEKYFATFSTKSSIEKIMGNLKSNYGIDFEINGREVILN
ncbi:FecR family protein [Flagellimonas flava]|uniref:FecR family protein n=1 Tax=Flagellimonas flava TaxID=570519 RepID=A0A1M5JXU4_9FLAO|nr:FecR family protein [Allomuricauda flava]SHG45376.1 FecR family protein [Allomuricauda flava]